MSIASPALKDVLVVGYGAVGAIYALVLKRSGRARVTVVARGNYGVVNEHGMHIVSQKYGEERGWRPDRLCASVAEAITPYPSSSSPSSPPPRYSHVFLATKALPELSPTPAVLAPLLSPAYITQSATAQPTYVLLQNGLGVERELYGALKERLEEEPKVVSAALWIGTNLVGPGEVRHNDFDRMSIGLYKPDSDSKDATAFRDEEEKATLDEIAEILEAGGSREVSVVPEVQRVKFRKNLWNLGFASFAALAGHPLPAVFQEPEVEARVVPVLRGVLEEAVAVGRALGFDEDALPGSVVDETIERTAAIHKRPDSAHRPSMLVDRETGRAMEVEGIVGEVVRAAREKGVSVPRIETVYALLSIVQRQLVKGAVGRA